MLLINSNRFYLKGTNKQALHLATIHHGVREFVCFYVKNIKKIYIEEISGGHLQIVEDDALFQELHDFLHEKRILDSSKPTLSDEEWLHNSGKNLL